MRIFATFICGLIFGLGLVLSGMANPLKVQNFLDLFGMWDPSLAFVMIGAIMVTMPGYRLLRKSSGPILGDVFQFPTKHDLDKNLITGAIVFGIGWGLGGFCPGPALTAISSFSGEVLVFVLAMLTGMVIANKASYRQAKRILAGP